jgi:hypothetical protein
MFINIVKNIMYIIVGFLAVVAIGSIAGFLNDLLLSSSSTFIVIVSVLFLTVVCRWVGKQVIEG